MSSPLLRKHLYDITIHYRHSHHHHNPHHHHYWCSYDSVNKARLLHTSSRPCTLEATTHNMVCLACWESEKERERKLSRSLFGKTNTNHEAGASSTHYCTAAAANSRRLGTKQAPRLSAISSPVCTRRDCGNQPIYRSRNQLCKPRHTPTHRQKADTVQ